MGLGLGMGSIHDSWVMGVVVILVVVVGVVVNIVSFYCHGGDAGGGGIERVEGVKGVDRAAVRIQRFEPDVKGAMPQPLTLGVRRS